MSWINLLNIDSLSSSFLNTSSNPFCVNGKISGVLNDFIVIMNKDSDQEAQMVLHNQLFTTSNNNLSVILQEFLHNNNFLKTNLNNSLTETAEPMTWGENKMTNYVEYAIYMVDRELERRHQLRPDLSKDQI
jgi:hypothetical protein